MTPTEYSQRQWERHRAPWKRVLRLQEPWRRSLLRHRPGRTLDVGCGVGRSLGFLHPDGVGVDEDPRAVEICRDRGFEAYLPDELLGSDAARRPFDTLLFSHVLEHVAAPDQRALIDRYLPLVRPGGLVIVMVPQERGFRFDDTHRTFMTPAAVAELCTSAGLEIVEQYSNPLPQWCGKWLPYNEWVTVARVPEVVPGRDT